MLNVLLHPTVIKIVLITTLLLAGVAYYKHNQLVRERLESEVSLQKFEIEQQKKAIASLVTNYEKIILARDSLSVELKKSRESIKKLEEKLYRENQGKSSLEKLARGRPTLIEKLINDATKDVLNCLENTARNLPCE